MCNGHRLGVSAFPEALHGCLSWLSRPHAGSCFLLLIFNKKKWHCRAVCVVWGVRVMQALPLRRVKQKGSPSATGILEQPASSWLEVLSSHKLADVTGTLAASLCQEQTAEGRVYLPPHPHCSDGMAGGRARSRGAGCAPGGSVQWIKETVSGLLVSFFNFCL